MRIVVDLQGAQSGSRFRGIGRYTVSFTKSLIKLGGSHEIVLVLNGLFPETIEPLRAEFGKLLPQESIRVWLAPGPLRACEIGNMSRREVAQHLREAFIASLQPDLIHICSLFEGYLDDAVVSVGLFDRHTPVSITVHDLIPLIHKEHYLHSSPEHHAHYIHQLQYLQKASVVLAVSHSTARELSTYTNILNSRISVTHEGIDEVFQPVAVSQADRKDIASKLGIHKPFLMYTGGCDSRKNLFRLLKAYSRLPVSLRSKYQIVFVGRLSESEIHEICQDANSVGLPFHDLVFSGHVSDAELVRLYNLCEVFVFPSWHEGFGLPVVEAMACGAVVISSSASSLSEIVERKDMLFDPFDVEGMSRALERALTDEVFREQARAYGLQRAKHFSWDQTAQKAFEAWEEALKTPGKTPKTVLISGRPRLAYVSPLPPVRSGISDYSAELLRSLYRLYDIEVVVDQHTVSDEWVLDQCPIRDVDYFQKHFTRYARVLYHLGNSPYHAQMLSLLERYPGVVTLHDFYLSGALEYLESHGLMPFGWTKALYETHGYHAIREKFFADNLLEVIRKYPSNLPWLQYALGVIVHSNFSRKMAQEWFGIDPSDWVHISHLRNPQPTMTREKAREILRIDPEDFVVASFGLLDPLKLNHTLLEAWLMSPLAHDPRCRLVFVGENHGGEYGKQLLKTIHKSPAKDRIQITGWVEASTFHAYLAAVDVAVQLRTCSRGETSGTILDCMKNALPVIANAHGSTAELPEECLWMLPDTFETRALTDALITLHDNPSLRTTLGQRGRQHILKHHDPDACAKAYYQAIEKFYEKARRSFPGLIQSFSRLTALQEPNFPLESLASVIASLFPPSPRLRHLFVDVSALAHKDLKAGIERVTRGILKELLLAPPPGWRVEPVYAGLDHLGYYSARKFTAAFLGIPDGWASDDPIDPYPGDVFFGLDFHNTVPVYQEPLLLQWRNLGIRVLFLIYDLLPILLPHHFPEGNAETHERWLSTVAKMDGAVCISKAVAEEFLHWWKTKGLQGLRRPFRLSYCHLGADFENTQTSIEASIQEQSLLSGLEGPIFLMVGTLEPRKGHLQTIRAFEHLWAKGLQAHLVLVGQEGWRDVPQHLRRTIPDLMKTLRNHPQKGRFLHWFPNLSDAALRAAYQAATCLLMASEGEGFGLPLIEAARFGLPILARDIPVFREIAGDYAFYFPNTLDSQNLAENIQNWLELHKADRHPKSSRLRGLTWKQCVQNLVRLLLAPSSSMDQEKILESSSFEAKPMISAQLSGSLFQ